MKTHVLIIEDNHAIAAQLVDYLTNKGFIVDYAYNGRIGLQLFHGYHFDVIILDLSLPDMDGIEVCHRIRANESKNPPILMLTARDTLKDKVKGFDSGTDDYLTKPFELEEVALRCVALTKRHQLNLGHALSIGDLVIDDNKKVVTRNDNVINLSITDFNILYELAKVYPNAISRTDLSKKVWGDDFPDTDALRSHIYTLRQAVDKPFEHSMIKTIHGVGFRLIAK